MMILDDRIRAFSQLGDRIRDLQSDEIEELVFKTAGENPWFTKPSILLALNGIQHILTEPKLSIWSKSYQFTTSRSVGIVMASNIPLVGFHDFMCVLMAGHTAYCKLSSQDTILLKFLIQELIRMEPRFAERIVIAEKLKGLDAMIATGSDNTSRYFEYYFRSIPHIIRKNRSSCAVIMGEEPAVELQLLGKDVFTYFGLGCRNVSKLFIPAGYDITKVLDCWNSYEEIINHHKYANNYDYQKSIMLVNQTPFLDNGFVLLTSDKRLMSPIAVIYFEEYQTLSDLNSRLHADKEKIQCIVSANGWYQNSIPFGTSQLPDVQDYADGIDTMSFLEFKN